MTPSEDQVGAVAALDEPNRRRLYAFVAAARRPVGRDEAAAALGIARETAAFHLDRLAAQGLLEVTHRRLTGRSGPGAGRPAKLYQRSEAEVAVSLPPRLYALGGSILAEAIEAAEARHVAPRTALADRAREHGVALALSAGSAGSDDPIALLEGAGFEPYEDGPGITRLANCPFHQLAHAHADLVCGMNLHLIGGLLDAVPTDSYVAELDPGPNRCCVKLTRSDRVDEGR
jgi:predicted ArsR family transcriptional regulator